MRNEREAIIEVTDRLERCFKEVHKYANNERSKLDRDSVNKLLDEFILSIANSELWFDEAIINVLNDSRVALSTLFSKTILDRRIITADWTNAKKCRDDAKKMLKERLKELDESNKDGDIPRGVQVRSNVGNHSRVIINASGRDSNIENQQAGDSQLVQLPKEEGALAVIGLKFGRLLSERIGLNTWKDLFIKILIPDVVSIIFSAYIYFSDIQKMFLLIPGIPAVILLSIFVMASFSRCNKCNRFFGMETVSRKHLRGLKLPKAYIQNIKETKQCIYCGHTEDEEINEVLEDN